MDKQCNFAYAGDQICILVSFMIIFGSTRSERDALKENMLPELEGWEHAGAALCWESDHVLFKRLQTLGAFRLPGMGMEQRIPPNPCDEGFYEQLRNKGARSNRARNGWFR